MVLDDLLADREPHAGALDLVVAVQALEQDEDALVVARVDAGPVVADRDLPVVAAPDRLGVHARRPSPWWYLIALPSRFCSTWTISPRSAITIGSGPAVTTAPASAIAAERLRTATLHAPLRSVGSAVVSPRPVREYSSSSAISESMRFAPATARSMNSRPSSSSRSRWRRESRPRKPVIVRSGSRRSWEAT